MEMEYKPIQRLLPVSTNKFNIIVVGAGGTGSHLIPNLCRLIKASGKNHNLTIIDGDKVEERNTLRQNFIHSDIGLNKAEALASRYSSAFGISINFMDTYISNSDCLIDLLTQDIGLYASLLIGCVDNNAARQTFHDVFRSVGNNMYIDSGNEEYFGQVVLGYNTVYNITEEQSDPRPFYCPPVGVRYPDILNDKETKSVDEMSCAERAVSAPQSMSANITAANCIINMLTILMLTSSGIRFSELLFNIHNGSVVAKYNTKEYFDSFCESGG